MNTPHSIPTHLSKEATCVPSCADPAYGWEGGCGHALAPQLKDCSPPLDPRVPSIWNTYPGWWNDIVDYQYGMKHYSKFAKTDDLFIPYQQYVEDQEGDEIPFKIAHAQDLRWYYWPGTTPFVGSIPMGETIAPPGLESAQKMQAALTWTRNVIAPQDATPQNVLGTQNPGNVFQLKPTSWNQRMLHNNATYPG